MDNLAEFAYFLQLPEANSPPHYHQFLFSFILQPLVLFCWAGGGVLSCAVDLHLVGSPSFPFSFFSMAIVCDAFVGAVGGARSHNPPKG